jgi:hypothetical protein
LPSRPSRASSAPDRPRRSLVGIHRLLVRAHEDDPRLSELTDVLDVPRRRYDLDWTLADNCWIQPSAVREALGARPDVQTRQVFAGDRATGRALTCYVHAARPLDPAELRVHVLRQARDHPAVIAPSWSVLVERPPGDPDDEAAWQTVPVLCEGSGNEGIVVAATDDRERALEKAVISVIRTPFPEWARAIC